MIRLINAGANVNRADRCGSTILHKAAQSGQKKVVRLFLAYGANVNALNSKGCTPLMIAANAKCERAEIVLLLLKSGAKLNVCDCEGKTAFNSAQKKSYSKTVCHIKEAIAREQKFIRAARQGEDKQVAQILRHGTNIDATDSKGVTALMAAAGAGHLAVVEQLLRAGADINKVDKDGHTALNHAAKKHHDAIVSRIKEVPEQHDRWAHELRRAWVGGNVLGQSGLERVADGVIEDDAD